MFRADDPDPYQARTRRFRDAYVLRRQLRSCRQGHRRDQIDELGLLLRAASASLGNVSRPLAHAAPSPKWTFFRQPALRPGDLRDERRGGVAMNVIPLHVRQKFERRWAARFASPAASTELKTTDLSATIAEASRPARVVQGCQIGDTSCFPTFPEPSTQHGIGS